MPTDTDWVPADHPDGRDTDPLWLLTDPPPGRRGPLQDLRWQRRMRPRWQRIAFVSGLAVLFALLFDPSRVLFAGLGLAFPWPAWPGSPAGSAPPAQLAPPSQPKRDCRQSR